MNKQNMFFLGLGLGVIILIKNSGITDLLKKAYENVDKGMDNVADYYVKKEMAWNEFLHNSDTLAEKYDNLLIWLGMRKS